jgi:uncharacterized protein
VSLSPTRRAFLFGLPAAALSAYGYVFHLEPGWLEVTQKQIPTGRNLQRPIRILHLSDLHASGIVPLSLIEHAFELGVAHKPDLICLTGDYVTTDTDFSETPYSRLLARYASRFPTYAVMGNHDGGVWAARNGWFANSNFIQSLLTRGGVTVLDNRAHFHEIGQSGLWLAGVGDWWSEQTLAPQAFADIPKDNPHLTVVLNHNPDGKSDCAPYPCDVMLSGHTHGGQVILPFYGPPIVPVLDTRYAVGLNRFGKRWIHTTRGVGNIEGFRLNCRPEVSLLTLT